LNLWLRNPEPLVGSKELEVVSPRIVGDRHLKMKLKKASLSLDAIGFAMGGLGELQGSALVDAVFTPAINEWNSGRYLQLILKAIRPLRDMCQVTRDESKLPLSAAHCVLRITQHGL